MARNPRTSSRVRPTSSTRRGQLVFTRRNYILLLVGVAAVVVGYLIMRLENQVDGIISLYVAPIVILGGYLEIIYAILWRPKEGTAERREVTA